MPPPYMMAQVPQHPYGLIYSQPGMIPGDFSTADRKATGSPEPTNRNTMLTDALLMDRMDKRRPSFDANGNPVQQSAMMSDEPMMSPYTDPYYAQQQGQQQQQMSLKQAKQAWDMYNNYQSLFGGSTAPAAGGLAAVPGGSGYGTAAGGAAYNAGVAAVPGGLSNAAVGTGAGQAIAPAAGTEGGLMGGFGGGAGGVGALGAAAWIAAPIAFVAMMRMKRHQDRKQERAAEEAWRESIGPEGRAQHDAEKAQQRADNDRITQQWSVG